MNMKKKPLLVTGSHRSGKTYLSKGIALSGKYEIIYEPLNKKTRLGISGIKSRFNYLNITADNEDFYKLKFDKILRYDYHFIMGATEIGSIRDVVRNFRDFTSCMIKKVKKKIPLIDDPFAIFSAEWFYECLGMDIVIVIRNPASFISSLKVLGYRYDFNNFILQNELMEKLKKFNKEIEKYADREMPLIDQGILLWRLIYHTVNVYKKKYEKNWYFVRFEDIAKNPVFEIERLINSLGVKSSDSMRNKIHEYSKKCDRRELEKEKNWMGVEKYSLNSQQRYFRLKLSDYEIGYIKERTQDVWGNLYEEDEW